MPVLEGVPRVHEVHVGEREALQAARALVTAGVAEPADWRAAKRKPHAFIERTVARWVRQGYGDMRPHAAAAAIFRCTDAGGWYLGIWFSGVEPVLFGPTLRLIEHYHCQLPRTFWNLFHDAMGVCADVFCDHRLEDHYEWYVDVMAMDDEEEDVTDEARSVPALMRRALPSSLFEAPMPLKRIARTIERAVPAGSLAAELMTRALALPDLARALKQSDEERERARDALADEWEDAGEPWPAFLMGIDPHDEMQAAYDVFEDQMFNSGMDTPPSHVIAFDLNDPASLQRARDGVVAVCRLLGHAIELVHRMPTHDVAPTALLNVLGGQAEAERDVIAEFVA